MEHFFKTLLKILIVFFSIGMVLFWVYLQFLPDKIQFINYYFNIGVGSLYLLVGFISFHYAFQNNKKPMQYFLTLYGMALVAWAFASFVWGYDNIVLHREIPYPSIADYFYVAYSLILGASFWFYFDIFQAKITKRTLRDSLLIVMGIYFLIFFVLNKPNYEATTPFIEVVFNYLYPLLDATILSLVVVAFRLEEKSKASNTLPLMLGILAQVIGDILFSYRSANNLYWNGDISDLFYLISGIFCFITLLQLRKDFSILQKQHHT